MAIVGLALAACGSAQATPAKKGTPVLSYDDAVRLLDHPATWCHGAAELTARKDPRALLPLMRAWDQPIEAEKLCLADALRALGGDHAAAKLVASASIEERGAGYGLMELFTSDANLPALRHGVEAETDERLRQRAMDALAQQLQTPAWEDAIGTLLADPAKDTRGWAIDRLAARKTANATAKLKGRLASESDPDLRAKLLAATSPGTPRTP